MDASERYLVRKFRGNPWEEIKLRKGAHVLKAEEGVIRAFNKERTKDLLIRLNLYPGPYLGDIKKSKIVLLNLNPGYHREDDLFHCGANTYFQQSAVGNLRQRFKNSNYPFFLLDPRINASPGYVWWAKRLGHLIDEVGDREVARKICCVEYFPYHSEKFQNLKCGSSPVLLDSQRYCFELVRQAMKRKALIIFMRSEKMWLDAIPELGSYDRRRRWKLKNPRSPFLSVGNLSRGKWKELIELLRY